jgi:hypothetical protein
MTRDYAGEALRRAGATRNADGQNAAHDDRRTGLLPVENGYNANEEIARLTKLSPVDYELERKSAAERMGIAVTRLDRLVKSVHPQDTKGQGRPLELPPIEPWMHPVNGAELLDAMCKAIRRFLVLPSGAAEVMALWAVHTHAFDCFNHSPRLAITSPEKGCGKTTALDVLRELVARPLPTSNVTASAVFRTVELASPTLLIDEADTFLKENEELRGILNSGHRKGTPIIRTVGDDYEPRQFSTWAPAAIAMIGNLPATLDDRSVTVRLRRRKPTEQVEGFRSDRVTDLNELARKAARWANDHSTTLTTADPEMGGLINRAADNWRPLFAIADTAGGEWPARVRRVAEGAEAEKQDQSVRVMLLSDIRDAFAARPSNNRISSAELSATLGGMEERPWAEWRNGKPMTASALSRMLSPFRIVSITRRDGSETFKGYLFSDFKDAFDCYLADQTVTRSQPNNDGHCDTLQSVTPESPVTLSKASQPNNDGHCDGVTLSGRGTRKSGANGATKRRCKHCGRAGGDLQEIYYGEVSALLHRDCQGAWRTAYEGQAEAPVRLPIPDDLSIPEWLDRSVA